MVWGCLCDSHILMRTNQRSRRWYLSTAGGWLYWFTVSLLWKLPEKPKKFAMMHVLNDITDSNKKTCFWNGMLNTPSHVSYFICHCIYFITNYPICRSTEVKGRILWLDIHKYKSLYSIDSYLRISDQVQESHNFLIQTHKVPCLEIRNISK